jgi:SAM-dependent methyltransferase
MNFRTHKHTRCRICGSSGLKKILDLGRMPPANAFVTKQNLSKKELTYPLDVYVCRRCNLVQLGIVVSPKILFSDYVYFSSTSKVFMQHFEELADTSIRRISLQKNSFVIDIGSNDGILLKPFIKKRFRVLGIEPARNIAQIANEAHVETIPSFFSVPLARRIKKSHGQADLITATNVFAHIDDIDEVIEGVKCILKENGVFIIEAPYLIDLLDNNLFDTIYHEHLSYFSVIPLTIFFRKHGMKIFSVEHTATHGGSLRIYAVRIGPPRKIDASVARYLRLEQNRITSLHTYKQFAEKIDRDKEKLVALLKQLRKQGKTIAGYGAPAKSNTLLNYYSISADLLSYIADDSRYKQNLYTPGMHIPVVSPMHLTERQPDYLVLLAWNFAESIMKKWNDLHEGGMKFILPKPEVNII